MDAQGNATGLPNLAGLAFGPDQACSPLTYAVSSLQGTYCATRTEPEQTITVQTGDARYFQTLGLDLHGIWIYNSDIATAKATQLPTFEEASILGTKKDGDGFYASSGSAPQSALTPIVQVLKRNDSTFAQNGSTPPNMVLFRKEAELQGVDSVKVWNCSANCYVDYFIETGGSSVEGTYQMLPTVPFFDEYEEVPALKVLVDKLGGVDKIDSNALATYVNALLFQDAVEKIVASGTVLTRQALLDQIAATHDFDAGGILGPTDVGNRSGSPCMMMVQVVDGTWKRVFPEEPYTFDCTPENLVQIKLNTNG